MSDAKAVYRFSKEHTDGSAAMRDLLGGKGANLAEMTRGGLPVPPGFTITTEVCARVLAEGGQLPADVEAQIDAAIAELEGSMGMKLGDADKPLLVSVRSGAAVSMPGMMDTILNLGLNEAAVKAVAERTNNPRFAWDSYRRFIEMYATVVVGLDRAPFEHAIAIAKTAAGVKSDGDLDAPTLEKIARKFLEIYREKTGTDFPTVAREQLRGAILAVFQSWNSDRAIKFREVAKIRGLRGTAVNVQAMVFGNMGDTSGTGVCFTRNPSTGAKELYGEYLANAQGEDIVAGIRTPELVAELERTQPTVHAELVATANRLETHFKNMQDIEFTVQEGRLFMLQTRHGKRTGAAALKIAVDLVREGLVTKDEAVMNLVESGHLDQMLHPHFADEAGYRRGGRVFAKGLPASPGAAVGRLVFHAEDAEAWRGRGERVILARTETSPEDVGGMHAAQGILTSRGGMTSHAAVVARGWGKPCVAGCSDVSIDERAKTMTNGKITLKEGDAVSLNGSTGEVISGAEALTEASVSADFKTFMEWVDAIRDLGVRTNADTPKDASVARELGAEGIGLCRTEHMFFQEERILHVREMILAETDEERKAALGALLPYQRDDFAGIFRAMKGLPVTIRLLDPPLHEFLPHEAPQQASVARALGVSVERVQMRVRALMEQNPMLGHRGCRLGITHPEITAMQARAILEAACLVKKEGLEVLPEIMVPLVGNVEELADQKAIVVRVAEEVFASTGQRVEYKIGTMIEVPRAALVADTIAREAEFFSFGTNDLTQMTCGFSRDDAGMFLSHYVRNGILPDDPFQTLDRDGVGQLVKMAVERGRSTKPGLKLGICGEHGGDPRSIAFFREAGLHYVSCSPFRVPVARLAAAQATLRARGDVIGKAGES
ncbi:MAG: pyruvate, phosphate dikinase [Polyangiaceae bacterium]